ncbi:right-handed parallel beta-helix repeat-containing protein [uncultured Methanobrevibacter sp.]|uniref:right-handed parallel beta-helix repeat-containing protein n=1 Tax=uncultured Methanobrevibacter sp. TaxID=253161 RepID=UPI00261A52EC
MNKVQLPSILALLLILFLSLSVVSANLADGEDGLMDNSTDVLDSSVGISDNSNSDLEISIDEGSDLISNPSNGSNLSDLDNKESDLEMSGISLDDESFSSDLEKENKKLSDSNEIVIDESSYLKYFDSNGAIIDGALSDGDTIRIGNLSNKVFTISKRLNILPISDFDSLKNCIIRLVDGSSGTLVSNIRINNTNERLKNYYLSGISIINSSNNRIVNSSIQVSQYKCFGIMMSNASHNEILSNRLIVLHASAIPMTGSSYNEIRDNYIETYNTNMIYYSGFGNGDFYPLDDLKSGYNIIANNYLTSQNGTYDSYCYAIQLMAETGEGTTVIANNTISNAFYAISVLLDNTEIINNTISDIGGEEAVLIHANNVLVQGNNISTERTDVLNWNEKGFVQAIEATGANIRIIDNTISSIESNAITSIGEGAVISNNEIYVYSANAINLTKSGALVENNTIHVVKGSAIKIYTSRLVENTTIRNNIIVSDSNGIVLQGRVNYTLICDNDISINDSDNAILITKYTNRNPILPEHYAVFNNTINGVLVSLTDLSEIERNDTLDNNGSSLNPSNGTDSNGTGVNETDLNNTGINGTINGTGLNETDLNGTGINGTINGTGLNDTDLNSTDNNITGIATSIVILNDTVIRGTHLEVYLSDADGNPIEGLPLILNLPDSSSVEFTDLTGKASFEISQIPGNYTLNISFEGKDYYLSSQISSKITVIGKTHYVNPDNFNDYFDDEGYLARDYSYDCLIFEGDFYDKRIILSSPVKIISNSSTLYDSVIKIESDNVTVEGFRIINANKGNIKDNHRFAISLDNVCNVNVCNNQINLSSFDNGYGIYVSESNENKIFNNSILVKANKLTFGIMLYDSNNNSIENNSISVNGTDNPHTYESNILVDTSISVDDYEADGMLIPEVYKTYGIILFYSSGNEMAYNEINATSGLSKYYTAVKESTNSIVAIDLYYDSNFNNVHHNKVIVNAKDPYLYGLGVLGAETGKRDQFAANNSFTDNLIFVNGTYYAAGLIAGYNAVNTSMLRNKIICISNNVSYGVILEGAIRCCVDGNDVISRSRINYVLEGYDSDYNVISNNTLNAYGQFVGDVSLYQSSHNLITRNSLSPKFSTEGKNKVNSNTNVDWDNIFAELQMENPFRNQEPIEFDPLAVLRDTDLTDHADVIPPHDGEYYAEGGTNNTFVDNYYPDLGSGASGSSSGDNANAGGSGGNSDGNANSNTNSTVVNGNSPNGGSGAQSNVDGSGFDSESSSLDGNTVGTSSSAAVSQSANAYNLNVDEPASAQRSLALDGTNVPVLCILLLLIFACASELIKRSKRDLR